MKKAVLVLLLFFTCTVATAQKKKYSFRDTLDNKLDFSEFLLDPHGFLPFMQPITEPALGHIGIMGGPLIIKPNRHQEAGHNYPPTITAIMGGYTGNRSWFVGGLRRGMFARPEIKYSLGIGYGSINLDFYREIEFIGEKSYEFNFRSFPVFVSFLKQVGKKNLFIGIEYIFMSTKVTPVSEDAIAEFPFDRDDIESSISMPAITLEYDNRDNTFTPDKGTYVNAGFHFNADWTGSDFNFQNYTLTALHYVPFSTRWISGFRYQSTWQVRDAPFYMIPSIHMRGVPQSRYQGSSTYLIETEQRYDFKLRWSGVFFLGFAKAVPEEMTFADSDLVYSYGAGFRYLIARRFKLRVGLDIAKSPDDFGYYLTFGSAWNQAN